jgi:hypothetical protein
MTLFVDARYPVVALLWVLLEHIIILTCSPCDYNNIKWKVLQLASCSWANTLPFRSRCKSRNLILTAFQILTKGIEVPVPCHFSWFLLSSFFLLVFEKTITELRAAPRSCNSNVLHCSRTLCLFYIQRKCSWRRQNFTSHLSLPSVLKCYCTLRFCHSYFVTIKLHT